MLIIWLVTVLWPVVWFLGRPILERLLRPFWRRASAAVHAWMQTVAWRPLVVGALGGAAIALLWFASVGTMRWPAPEAEHVAAVARRAADTGPLLDDDEAPNVRAELRHLQVAIEAGLADGIRRHARKLEDMLDEAGQEHATRAVILRQLEADLAASDADVGKILDQARPHLDHNRKQELDALLKDGLVTAERRRRIATYLADQARRYERPLPLHTADPRLPDAKPSAAPREADAEPLLRGAKSPLADAPHRGEGVPVDGEFHPGDDLGDTDAPVAGAAQPSEVVAGVVGSLGRAVARTECSPATTLLVCERRDPAGRPVAGPVPIAVLRGGVAVELRYVSPESLAVVGEVRDGARVATTVWFVGGAAARAFAGRNVGVVEGGDHIGLVQAVGDSLRWVVVTLDGGAAAELDLPVPEDVALAVLARLPETAWPAPSARFSAAP